MEALEENVIKKTKRAYLFADYIIFRASPSCGHDISYCREVPCIHCCLTKQTGKVTVKNAFFLRVFAVFFKSK